MEAAVRVVPAVPHRHPRRTACLVRPLALAIAQRLASPVLRPSTHRDRHLLRLRRCRASESPALAVRQRVRQDLHLARQRPRSPSQLRVAPPTSQSCQWRQLALPCSSTLVVLLSRAHSHSHSFVSSSSSGEVEMVFGARLGPGRFVVVAPSRDPQPPGVPSRTRQAVPPCVRVQPASRARLQLHPCSRPHLWPST